MSCEANDKIIDNIRDKIAEMSLKDKKLYLTKSFSFFVAISLYNFTK